MADLELMDPIEVDVLRRESDRLRTALINLLERIDQHFGGPDRSADWKEQEEARAVLSDSEASDGGSKSG